MGVVLFPLEIRPRAYWHERMRYLELFRRWRPDLVHTHGYRADLVAGSAARAAALPWVTTFHGFTGGSWKNRLYEMLQVRSARSAAGVVAVSRPLQERLTRSGIPGARIALITNGLNRSMPLLTRSAARAELGLPETDWVVGWVGRLTREKGADVLLAALPGAPEVRVSIVGLGAERRALEAQAGQLAVTSRVRWHGLVANACRIYSAFDCFVLSSRTEGTPIALLEAMAAGVPIVATSVGGVPDVLRSEEGLLVPPEDPAALARGIASVLRDPVRARERAERARERVEGEYAPGPWIERHRMLYQQILDRPVGTPA
jgi:glycosyltransferase involved in cell wall biosynthesis